TSTLRVTILGSLQKGAPMVDLGMPAPSTSKVFDSVAGATCEDVISVTDSIDKAPLLLAIFSNMATSHITNVFPGGAANKLPGRSYTPKGPAIPGWQRMFFL